MRLEDVAMVAADTSRSRAYLQALVRHSLLPSHVLILSAPEGRTLPGQAMGAEGRSPIVSLPHADDRWPEAQFDPSKSLGETLDDARVPAQVLDRDDINHPEVIAAIERRPERVFVYSGYGGVLLGPGLLATGKRFLHVHGGYLPDYKGSTTNYYSLLIEDALGASSLFLSREIDSGPVLRRRKFPPPPDRRTIDHVYDSAARARVLVETLQDYVARGDWRFALAENAGGRTYFIIHPVLKHIAILASKATEPCA